MTKLAAFLILIAVIVAITVLVCVEHRPSGYAMPLLFDAAAPVIVPWTLNTRCAVNSKNLPLREPERNA